MVSNDLVGRLPRINKRCNDHVLLMQFMFCHVYTSPGRRQTFLVLTVCKDSIVTVLVGNGTVINGFRTSVTDIRSFIEAVAPFFDEIRASLVTGRAGSTFNVAEYDFSACISFSAVVSVNAEVMRIKEGTFMIPITHTMELHFLRNSSRILT